VRDVLALIRCGNRIYEVTTATLGPLPLDQLPKSKPVTPYAVSLIVLTIRTYAKRPAGSWNADWRGHRGRNEKPLRALAVAEDALAGA
jgi:hypothetical protein